jgi:predicted Zn-dependent protease
MRSTRDLKALLEGVLERSPADETELVARGYDSALTRFAGSTIHQNVHEDDTSVIVRVVTGKRIGVVSTNRLDEASVDSAVARAMEIAKQSPQEPDFPGLPKADPAPEVATFSSPSAGMSAAERAEGVAKAVAEAGDGTMKLYGAYRVSSTRLVVANTSGTNQAYDGTDAFLSVFAIDENGISGSTSGYAVGAEELDPAALAATAVEKCRAAADPISIPPEPIDVILEPRAISEILEWMNFTSFGAKQVQEGQSFMAGRAGRQVMGENITIYDDGYDTDGIPIPFDFEGVPKRRVALIDKGIVGAPVYDSLTASKDGTTSTGHATPAVFRGGPSPSNLFIAPGDETKDDLLRAVRKGLLVTRFHYVNGMLDTRKALFTGMTRDGTFLIEDGKIAQAVKNMRFNESMLKALSQVEGVTKERETSGRNWGGIGSVTAPTMLIRGFRFTGSTEF